MNNNLDLKSTNFGNVSFFNTVFHLISRDTLNSINTKGNFTFSTHLLLLGNRMKQCVSCLICCIMQISQNLKSEKIQWYHAQQWSSSLLVLTEKSYFLYRLQNADCTHLNLCKHSPTRMVTADQRFPFFPVTVGENYRTI